MKKAIQIKNAPAPIGPYSQAIIKGNTCYVSGQIPLNPQTGELVTKSIEDATRQVMENIKALILESGFEMNDVVKCSIFLSNLGNFDTINNVYSEYFQAPFPARETVEVSKLPKSVDVEISCIAIK